MGILMSISEAVILITGANRGLGLALAKEALKRGAKRVYAGMRNTQGFNEAGLIPIEIDVSNDESVQNAAKLCTDVNLLINNAGIAERASVLADDLIEISKHLLDTNTFGVIRATRAFAPVIEQNGGGIILNILSSFTWAPTENLPAYAISKAGVWSYTNSSRRALKPLNIHVIGLHVATMDTDLAKMVHTTKTAPEIVAIHAFDGVEARQDEIIVDQRSKELKQGLSALAPSYIHL